jgi:YbbR domain-containing protein
MDENGKKRFHIPMIDLSDNAKRTRWALRVISIVLAMTLWFFVSWDGSSDSRIRELTVPLRYLDVPEGYLISDRVSNILVRVQGSVELLSLLDRNSVTASVSLQELRPGKYRLPVYLNSPERVRIVGFSPQDVEFELYRVIERTMRPSLEITDEMPDDVSLSDIAFEPAEVVVKGAEADVMAVHRAVARARVDDLTDGGPGPLDLPVTLLGADGGETAGLEIEPRRVRLSFRVSEAVEEILVPINVPVRGTPGNGLDIGAVQVSPDAALLRGTKEALANITELTLGAIDVTGHTEEMVADIPLDAPAQGISIANADSVRVRVQFHSTVDTRTFVGVPIAVIGKGAYSAWLAAPAVANVMLERAVTSTEPFDMNKPPLELYVDVTNVVAEHLVLPVLVQNLHDGMKVIRIEPQQVSVSAVRN